MLLITETNVANIVTLMRGGRPTPPEPPLVQPQPPRGLPRSAAAWTTPQAHARAEQGEMDAVLEATMPRAYVDNELIPKQPTPEQTSNDVTSVPATPSSPKHPNTEET